MKAMQQSGSTSKCTLILSIRSLLMVSTLAAIYVDALPLDATLSDSAQSDHLRPQQQQQQQQPQPHQLPESAQPIPKPAGAFSNILPPPPPTAFRKRSIWDVSTSRGQSLSHLQKHHYNLVKPLSTIVGGRVSQGRTVSVKGKDGLEPQGKHDNHHKNRQGSNTKSQKNGGLQYYGVSTRDQVVHHCTSHFVALLNSELSDGLLPRLSRLVMTLPVVGVETRSVLRAEVTDVIRQIAQGISDYSVLQPVIMNAMDDAGLLDFDSPAMSTGVSVEPSAPLSSLQLQHQQQQQQQQTSGDEEEDEDENDNFDMNRKRKRASIIGIDDDEEELVYDEPELDEVTAYRDDDDYEDSDPVPLFSSLQSLAYSKQLSSGKSLSSSPLPSTPPSSSPPPSRGWFEMPRWTVGKSVGYSTPVTNNFDESQIPDIADVAMEAVVGYLAEVIHPKLLIHQLAEAIQATLQRIHLEDRQKAMTNWKDQKQGSGNDPEEGENNNNTNEDVEGNNNGNESLLDEEWIWQQEQGEVDDQPEDEDLWDQDMEINQWDSTGRLFDDEEDETVDEPSKPKSSASSSVQDSDDGQDWTEEDIQAFDQGAIGIQDGDEEVEDEDEEESEDMSLIDDEQQQQQQHQQLENGGEQFEFDEPDIDRQTLFQKRGFVEPKKPGQDIYGRSRILGTNTDESNGINSLETAVSGNNNHDSNNNKERRRTSRIAPTLDPKLENLLTQMMEPAIQAFVDNDFPSACRRVQGELMDGIMWSVDQVMEEMDMEP